MSHEHLIIHQIFEFIGYLVGGYIFRNNSKTATLKHQLNLEQKVMLIFGLLCGALVGSKTLATLTYWNALQAMPLSAWLGGKTIVGGLLGGLIGIEISKKLQHITTSTGDAFTIPLIVGMAIGRIGCAQAGIEDYTFGNPTTLPWGMNLGDGIPRHPTAIYEIIFLLILGIILHKIQFKTLGLKFKIFMASYLTFRLLVDFLKPPHGDFAHIANILPATIYFRLSAIQIACIFGLIYYSYAFIDIYKNNHQQKAH
jgi:prolipoprotein diacylglyceryltransferase